MDKIDLRIGAVNARRMTEEEKKILDKCYSCKINEDLKKFINQRITLSFEARGIDKDILWKKLVG